MQLNNQSLLKDRSYINGAWVNADSGKTFKVKDPATHEVITEVPDLDVSNVRQAIEAAHKAFQTWSRKLAGERARVLRKWNDLILENQEDLAQLMTAEQGKPLAESRGEVEYGASFIDWFAEESRRVYGDVVPTYREDRRVVVIKQPIGVMASITPWNFPIAMITRKVAPALAAGCTAVVKPSEETPLCALALAELAHQAGIPEGVFNVITTLHAKKTGEELTTNPLVKKISFTGSTAVGKKLMEQSAGTVKKVSLELGGNAPFIVFDDADLEEAVTGAVQSKYRNSGQTCVCANRIFVQEGIYDEFVQQLTKEVATLKMGVGTEKDVTIGPLINQEALEKVGGIVEDARSKGATVTIGGSPADNGSWFFEPTVLKDANENMACHKEEIFGPVAPVFKFSNEEEVIRMANNTTAGLASYFYSRDMGRIWRVAEALDYGMVGINTGLISTAVAPFGGVKESGIGREGSKYGIEEFVEIKYLCMAGID